MAYQLSLSDEPTKALLQCNLSLFFHLPSAILRLKTLQRIDNVCVMAVADGLQMKGYLPCVYYVSARWPQEIGNSGVTEPLLLCH